MPRGRPTKPVVLSDTGREQLTRFARSRSMPQGLVTRAKIVLCAADAMSNTEIAQELDLSRPTVGKWRQRYLDQGIPGLYDETWCPSVDPGRANRRAYP